MRKLLSTLALAALMAGAAASAQAREGWYGRADIGFTVGGEAEIPSNNYDYYDETDNTESYVSEWNFFSSDTADLDDGWMVDAGVGYVHGNGLRTELELARRTDEASGSGNAYAEALSVNAYNYNSSSHIYATSLMLNGFYDFNRDGSVQPYVGLGVGYAKVEVGEPDDSNWAWQALAGVGIELNDRMTLDVGYRYFNVDELDYASIKSDYTHEAVTLGLRYQFAAPAPVSVAQPEPMPTPAPEPIPAPAPCPTSQFVVYFEWDRSNLNQEAMTTIDQAVARARQCNVNAVAIVGHTDTSGSNAYNMGLSGRRALIVRDAMTARGMSDASMTMQARGESELAQATRDGVREPLNRRTAVTINFK